MHEVPGDTPTDCPACGVAYDSVSAHDRPTTVALRANERYARVCFEPRERDGRSVLYFYHHTHEQVAGAVGRNEERRPE
jgi:hypothetical protein